MTRLDYVVVLLVIGALSCGGIFLSSMIPQPVPLPTPRVTLPTSTPIPVTPISQQFDFLARETSVWYQDDTGHTIEVSNDTCITLLYGCIHGFSVRHNYTVGGQEVEFEVALSDCRPNCVVTVNPNLKFQVTQDGHKNLQVYPPIGWKRK